MTALEPVAQGLWARRMPLSVMGLKVGARMTIARLSGDRLLLHSPTTLDDDTRRAVDELGQVAFIVAPSRMHHFFVGDWGRAYPDARVYGAPGLGKKRKDVAFAGEFGERVPDGWPEEFGVDRYEGSEWMSECVFLHRPSRTLLLTDLAFNFASSDSWFTRRYLSWSDALGKFGQSKLVRLSTKDRDAARRSVDRILKWDFDRVVVCHGEVLESGGREAVERIFGWL